MHLGIIPDGNRRFCKESGIKQSELTGVLTGVVEGMLADLVALWTGAADPALAAELAPLLDVDRVTVFLLSANNVEKRTDMSKANALNMIERMFSGVGGGGGGGGEGGGGGSEGGECGGGGGEGGECGGAPRGGTDSTALLLGKALACFGGELSVSVVGDRSLLPPDVDHKLAHMQRECKGARYFLTLAVGYDGEKDLDGGLSREEVPPIDAVFRSGREKRLSGFFPRQTMHSELIFSDKLWPQIRLRDIAEAVTEFRSRNRLFGA